MHADKGGRFGFRSTDRTHEGAEQAPGIRHRCPAARHSRGLARFRRGRGPQGQRDQRRDLRADAAAWWSEGQPPSPRYEFSHPGPSVNQNGDPAVCHVDTQPFFRKLELESLNAKLLGGAAMGGERIVKPVSAVLVLRDMPPGEGTGLTCGTGRARGACGARLRSPGDGQQRRTAQALDSIIGTAWVPGLPGPSSRCGRAKSADGAAGNRGCWATRGMDGRTAPGCPRPFVGRTGGGRTAEFLQPEGERP